MNQLVLKKDITKRGLILAVISIIVLSALVMIYSPRTNAASYWQQGGYSTLSQCQRWQRTYGHSYVITKPCFKQSAPATGYAFGYLK